MDIHLTLLSTYLDLKIFNIIKLGKELNLSHRNVLCNFTMFKNL